MLRLKGQSEAQQTVSLEDVGKAIVMHQTFDRMCDGDLNDLIWLGFLYVGSDEVL